MSYAVALRLARAGASQAMIAEALGIEPEGVPATLRLANAKLDALARTEEKADEERGHPC